MPQDMRSLLESWREAIRRDDSWLARQEPLYHLVESLPPDIALEVARKRLLDFVPYFEQNAFGGAWARGFLSQSILPGRMESTRPVNFCEEEDRHTFPGAANFISAVEDFWIALGEASSQLFVRHVVASLSGVVMAEFAVRQASKDPLQWLKRQEMVRRISAASEKGESDPDSRRWLVRAYLMRRKDPWWYEQLAELWLRVADMLEEMMPQ
jgi:hypothetical protein